jgi:probable rRNA maturation factor
MTIEVLNESGVAVDEAQVLDLARFVLEQLRIHPLADLSIMLVDEATMERLHVQWMDEPGATDVLSFPMDELRPTPDGKDPEPGLLGDVVVCPAVAERQAAAARHSRDAELQLLTTHGILHLLGYDHAEPAQEREMFGLQDRLLAQWRRGNLTAPS